MLKRRFSIPRVIEDRRSHRPGAHALAVLAAAACLEGLLPAGSHAEPLPQFLRRPDIHGDQIVFMSEGDLWLGSMSQRSAFRLTNAEGSEGPAFFSPDGRFLAFTAAYDGARDVYVMDVEGGPPTRLTWDSYGVNALGWTPDGKNIVFRSWRGTTMRQRFWSVPATGGAPTLLPVPYGHFGSVAADGRIAYVPVSAEWQNWKRYRGGLADDIWLADPGTGAFRRLTDFTGVDTEPIWVGKTIYFVSERDGLPNLHVLDPETGDVRAVTSYTDYDVRYPETDGQRVIYEHGDGLAIYDPATGRAEDCRLDLRSDRVHAREKRVPALNNFFGVRLGPTGKRVLISARGQILSAPVEHGDVRTIEAVHGARAQYPAWSRDCKQVAFVSDRSGEEQVWIVPSKGGEARQVTRDHRGQLGPIIWSPDGGRLATSDREKRILLVDVETGQITVVDQSDHGPSYNVAADSFRFSPDGKWLAYSFVEPNWNWTVRLYDIARKKSTTLTSPEMSSYAPAFDSEGKFLYFLSDRAFQPRYVSGNRYFTYGDMTKVSLVTLSKDGESPFLDPNEEEGGEDATGKEKEKDEKKGGRESDEGTAFKLPDMTIDLEGLAERIVEVPVPAADYRRVEPIEGKLLLETFVAVDDDAAATPLKLQTFDLEKKEAKVLVERYTAFDLSADGKKLLVRQDKTFTTLDATAEEMPKDDGAVETANWIVTVDPASEWKQIFYETWRIARDFFYDPNLHGVDWSAVQAKYARMLPAVADRTDLTSILGLMVAELNCGHAYVVGGDVPPSPSVPMGFLCADVEPVVGRTPAYRVTDILPGDGFDLEARSPLLTPGVRVNVGDYILSVAGQPVRADRDLQSLLVGTAGRAVQLQVNSRPSLDGARMETVVPKASEGQARYYAWVEGRGAYLRDHGGEHLAYVHIPDMGDGGMREFGKHYYANLDRDGMIFDVRFNGGGYIDAMLLLQISSPRYSYFKPRHGASWSRQDWAMAGRSVALCNDQSGSDAEEFSDAFQRLAIGPVIGARSWGGEVGSGRGYSLTDGGAIFIPNYAEWVPEGQWVIEGVGVRPDIVVEDDPAALMAGKDPQLDAAIAYLNAKLVESPLVRPSPPPYPNKAESGSDGTP